MYTFVRVQCHPKVPTLQGWYLKISTSDFCTYTDVHLAVASKMFHRAISDPHNYTKQGNKRDGSDTEWKDMYSDILHPVKIANQWLLVTSNYLSSNGSILINENGGWMTYNENLVLETRQSDRFVFPKITKDEKEIITIKRWPMGNHWYLVSSRNRIFVPEKTNTLEQAISMAKEYVSEKNIKIDETKTLKPE